MNERFSIPIYLNTLMLQNLSSNLINGFYSELESKNDYDLYVLARRENTQRRQNTDDVKTSSFPLSACRPPALNSPFSIRGPKTNDAAIVGKELQNVNLTLSLDEAILNYDECFCLVEGRDDFFREQRTIRSYTLFSFFPPLIDRLKKCGVLKFLPDSLKSLRDICVGDYVEFCGKININTISTYTALIINLLNSYGTAYLDENVDTSDIGPLNYAIISSLLSTLVKSLNNNPNTQYLVFADNYAAVVTLNNEYISSDSYFNDSVGNRVKVIGKVSGITDNCNAALNLLDKTGYSGYYFNLLQTILPYLARLNEKGYPVPLDYISLISPPAIDVIPLAIYI